MNKSNKKRFTDLVIRYAVLLIIAISGLSILYFIFEPLTKYPTYFLFNIFYDIYVTPVNIINFRGFPISLEIIGACIAGSAYFLLLMLNLSTPGLKFPKRIKLLLLSFLIFLVFNIIRIFVIGVLFLNTSPVADILHKFLWYFGSIVLVILIWFYQVNKYKIKGIPFYSDIKFLFKNIK